MAAASALQMHTLLARDAPPPPPPHHHHAPPPRPPHRVTAVPTTASPVKTYAPHLVVHYDAHTGKIDCLSPTFQLRDEGLGLQDPEPQGLMRRPTDPQQPAREVSIDDGMPKGPPIRRQNGKLGTVMRKLFPRKISKQHISLPTDVHHTVSAYPGDMRPGTQVVPPRPISTPENQHLPVSPLASHPFAVADAGDAVARISKFVSHQAPLPRGSSLPNVMFSAPAAGSTWYDTRNTSFVTADGEKSPTRQETARLSPDQSSRSLKRRSKSVSALSEATHSTDRQVIRPRRSTRTLRSSRASEPQRRKNSSPHSPKSPRSPHFSAYRSSSSEHDEEPMPELPADFEYPRRQESDAQAQHQEPSSGASLQPPQGDGAPRRTFDFDSLANAMGNQEHTDIRTIEERMTTVEVKLMDLEYAISKVQARVPSQGSVVYRRPSTSHGAPSATVHNASYSQDEPLIRRKKSPPARLEQAALQAPAKRTLASRSSASTIRPATRPSFSGQTAHQADPEVVVPTDPTTHLRPSSVTLLTVEHYSKLVSLLRHEQTARKQLATQIGHLEAEILALRPLIHAPLGNSYHNFDAAQSAPIDNSWAILEEYRSGKLGNRSGNFSSDKDHEVLDRGRARTRPEDLIDVPPSPTASETTSESSFGGDLPLDDVSFGPEARFGGLEHDAGQAF